MNVSRLVSIVCLLALSALLPACVTTSTDSTPPPAPDKDIAAVNTQLGVSYLRQGDYQKARAKLEKAIDLDPRSTVAQRALALVYERLEDYDAAERHYRYAYKLAPKDADVLNGLAVFLCFRKHDVDGALKLFDQAIAVPASAQYSDKTMLNTNAGTCARRKDLAMAEDYLRAALAHDSRSADALLQIADVSFQRGNSLQTRAFLERYFDLPAVSPAALWLGVQVETRMGGVREARQYAERLKREFPASVETRLLLERERDAGS